MPLPPLCPRSPSMVQQVLRRFIFAPYDHQLFFILRTSNCSLLLKARPPRQSFNNSSQFQLLLAPQTGGCALPVRGSTRCNRPCHDANPRQGYTPCNTTSYPCCSQGICTGVQGCTCCFTTSVKSSADSETVSNVWNLDLHARLTLLALVLACHRAEASLPPISPPQGTPPQPSVNAQARC